MVRVLAFLVLAALIPVVAAADDFYAVPSQAKDLTFIGAVPLAPGSHLKDLAPLADAPERGSDLLAYAAASIKASDPSFEYRDMLLAPLLTEMPRAEVTSDVELFQYFDTTYRGLTGLRPDWLDQADVAAWFDRNEPGRRQSSGPILLLQGGERRARPGVRDDGSGCEAVRER